MKKNFRKAVRRDGGDQSSSKASMRYLCRAGRGVREAGQQRRGKTSTQQGNEPCQERGARAQSRGGGVPCTRRGGGDEEGKGSWKHHASKVWRFLGHKATGHQRQQVIFGKIVRSPVTDTRTRNLRNTHEQTKLQVCSFARLGVCAAGVRRHGVGKQTNRQANKRASKQTNKRTNKQTKHKLS